MRPDQFTPRSGDMRTAVSIQSPVWDSPKSKITSWSDVLSSVMAYIEPMQGIEAFRAMREVNEQWFRVLIHWTSTSINTEMRVNDGTLTYDVRSVRNIEGKNRMIELSCRRVA